MGFNAAAYQFLSTDSVEKFTNANAKSSLRRQRQHEIMVALIQTQEHLELMDDQRSDYQSIANHDKDPARWIDKNRRILEKYQSLVRSAITLDALLESEQSTNQ